METETKKRGGILRWFAVLMAIFIAAGTVFGMTQMGGDSRVYAAEGTWIYVDGANGNDSNDGSSAGLAVKSWDKAKELLGCAEGGIYVVGTVEASGVISTKDPSKQSVKRSDDFTGVMFEVSGEVTFANIDVDGENKHIDGEVIKPNAGATLNFLEGAVFHNIGYVEDASENEKGSEYNPDHTAYQGPGTGLPDNFIGGVVCSLVDPVTILVDGATFTNNDGKGVFFTPLTGGNGGKANVTVYVKSVDFNNNKGYFYHNEGQYSTNKLYIYDALVRNNDASHIADRYSSYYDRTGVVYVCDVGGISIKDSQGPAIFDNTNYDLMTQYDFMQGTNQGQKLRFESMSTMLGGGNPNWGSLTAVGHDAIDTDMGNYYAYKSNPSEADKAAAVAAAKSKFENNGGSVFASNGTIQFGHALENPPSTPYVPIDQSCDNEPTPEPETVDIKVTKEWKNAEGTGAATTLPSNARFQLYADGKAVDKQVATITKDQGWTVTFKDQPKYQADGTTEIEYTVDEVSYEPVDSFDKGECTGDAATGFTWTNREKPVEEGAEGKADIVLTKKVTNGNIADYTFKFKIEAESATDAEGNAIKDIPLPAETEVANDAEGKIKFDTITYTKPGTYRYKVTEVIPDKKIDKMHYDTNAKFVTVRVTKAAQ